MKQTDHKYIKLAAISGSVVIVDQISKAIILKTLPLYGSVPVIPGLFNLTHIHNPGGAFGFFARQEVLWRNAIFLFASALAICLIFYLYRNTPKTDTLLATAIALILGGAFGNLTDRIRFGEVVDFLDFYVGDLHWPAFNIADSSVSAGVIIFLFYLLFKKMPK